MLSLEAVEVEVWKQNCGSRIVEAEVSSSGGSRSIEVEVKEVQDSVEVREAEIGEAEVEKIVQNIVKV